MKNECFQVCFDYSWRKDTVTAAILEPTNKGFSLVKTFEGEEAEDLYLQLTGEPFSPFDDI